MALQPPYQGFNCIMPSRERSPPSPPPHTHTNLLMIVTVYIRILAMAIINFSHAGMRLLIEGGSYSREDFNNDTSW